MKPTSLLLNNKQFSYEQIKTGNYTVDTEFENRTLTFCSQWLNGQDSFEQKTSGSTGIPKPIQIFREQMLISALQTVKVLKLKPNNTALVCVDSAFIAGKMMLVRAFEHHMKIIIVEPTSTPFEGVDSPIDFVAMIPLQLQNTLLNPATKEKINACKAVIIGGAPVSAHLASLIANINTPIYSSYGMTETVSHIALKKLSYPPQNFYSTIGNIKLRLNENNQLIIKGAITSNKEVVTNDRVQLLSPTTFIWLGRTDNTINSGGVKIQIEEVEASISLLFERLNIDNRFFLDAEKDDTLGQKLVLYIEGYERTLPSTIMEKMKIQLDKFECPKHIYYIPTFDETSTGKINRRSSVEKGRWLN